MGTEDRDVDFAAHNVVIHFSTVFDGRTPALCGAQGIPCPASNERRYVSCPRCLARLGPLVHARPSASSAALCSAPAGVDRWTTRRSEVTCGQCNDEIARRYDHDSARAGSTPAAAPLARHARRTPSLAP